MELEYKSDVFVPEIRQFLVAEPEQVDIIAVYVTVTGFFNGSNDLQKSRFTGTRGSHNGNDLAFSDLEVNAFEHFNVAEFLVYVMSPDQGFDL